MKEKQTIEFKNYWIREIKGDRNSRRFTLWKRNIVSPKYWKSSDQFRDSTFDSIPGLCWLPSGFHENRCYGNRSVRYGGGAIPPTIPEKCCDSICLRLSLIASLLGGKTPVCQTFKWINRGSNWFSCSQSYFSTSEANKKNPNLRFFKR